MDLYIIVLCLAVCIGMFHARRDRLKSRRLIIGEALSHLLAGPDGTFVIIEEPKSGKFVEFAFTNEKAVIFDLPSISLSTKEVARAKAIFDKWGYASPETHRLQGYPGSFGVQEITIFNVGLGKDIGRATELAVTFFEKVYKLRNGAKLVVHTVLPPNSWKEAMADFVSPEYIVKLRQQILSMKERSDPFYSSQKEREEMQVFHLRMFVEELSQVIMPQLAEDCQDTTAAQREEARRRWLVLAYQMVGEVLSEEKEAGGP